MSNLFNAFKLQARSDSIALELRHAKITYADLADVAARLSGRLDELEVMPGDRVVVQVEKSHIALALFLACLQRGAIFIPLNTAYTAQELAFFIGDAEPKLVVCDPAQVPNVAAAASTSGAAVLTLAANGHGSLTEAFPPPQWEVVERAEDDLAAILYTSGTTGKPKGAMLSHGNLASNASALRDFWRFSENDVLLHALPIYHAHGLFIACNVVLLAGGSMIFLPKFDLDEVFLRLPDATTMMGIPTFYTRMLASERLTPDLLRGMRLFTCGSAPLLAETHVEWFERTGHSILERYGMTETGMITSNPYDGDRIAGSVGVALPGTDVRIVDPEGGGELPSETIGMIEVRGANVFKGYWRLPEKTAAEMRADGFFITGDLGTIDQRGYVRIVGRGKDLIISGGLNVYPKEVEAEIDSFDGIVESAVFGVSHPDFGEAVTAVVVLQPGCAFDEKAVIGQLSTRLARFKLPKRIVVVPELPRNTMGKVQKADLRDEYRALYL